MTFTFEDACAIAAPNVVRGDFRAKPRAVSAGWLSGPDPQDSLSPSERAFGETMRRLRASVSELEAAGYSALIPARDAQAQDAKDARFRLHSSDVLAALTVASRLLASNTSTGDVA